jgi:hypothetical protein
VTSLASLNWGFSAWQSFKDDSERVAIQVLQQQILIEGLVCLAHPRR